MGNMIVSASRKQLQFFINKFVPVGMALLVSFLSPVQAEDLETHTLRGKVLYQGAIPPPEESIIKHDAQVCGETRQITPITISQDRGLQLVVGSVEGMSGAHTHKKTPFVLRNDKCQFFPSLGIASAKQPLEVQNLDSILHNTHIRTKKRAFINVVLLPQAKGIKKIIKKPGLMTIACNKHPFMKGFIHVFDHPYHAVTDSQGAFTIPNLPPGTHTLSLWHKTLGTIQQSVTLPQKHGSTLNISFPTP